MVCIGFIVVCCLFFSRFGSFFFCHTPPIFLLCAFFAIARFCGHGSNDTKNINNTCYRCRWMLWWLLCCIIFLSISTIGNLLFMMYSLKYIFNVVLFGLLSITTHMCCIIFLSMLCNGGCSNDTRINNNNSNNGSGCVFF